MKRLILVVSFLLVGLTAAGAQDTDPTPSPALVQQMDGIERQTSALRHLDLLQPITRRFPTRDELVAYLEDIFDKELPPDVAAQEVLFYSAFDLLPADTNLRAIYLRLYSAQIAGFYDTDTKEMNVILTTGQHPGNSLPLLEELTYSHEYVHALQDQHFGLQTILNNLDPNAPDAALAVQSLVEGDATLAMSQYTLVRVQDNPELALLQILFQGLQTGGLVLPPGIPQIIQDELLYPYEAGLNFVSTLYNTGGWDRVDETYSALPVSSEQIDHPERYLAGDMPQTVTLPDVDLSGEGWTLGMERTMGEFYLREYLATQLPPADAAAAAEGWGGDRFQIYQNDAGQTAWVLRIAWDTAADSAEFATAYQTFAAARMSTPLNTPCWGGEGEELCFQTDSSGDSTISYAPTHDLALMLLGGN